MRNKFDYEYANHNGRSLKVEAMKEKVLCIYSQNIRHITFEFVTKY
jgi:hypothetical protein